MSATSAMQILGLTFEIDTPYAEGHTVNAAEAKVLNQTRRENISNAVRTKIKELQSEDGTYTSEAAAKAQEIVAEYNSTYVFTLASAGGGRTTKDPIQKEAESLARAAITAQLKAAGRAIKDVDKDKLAEKIAEVAEMPEILKQAKARVAARNKMVEGLSIDI